MWVYKVIKKESCHEYNHADFNFNTFTKILVYNVMEEESRHEIMHGNFHKLSVLIKIDVLVMNSFLREKKEILKITGK